MVSKKTKVCTDNFPASGKTMTEGRTGYILLKLLEFSESYQKTICSENVEACHDSSHFCKHIHTDMHANHDL